MSEKGKEILTKLMETIPKLDVDKQNYVLGVAEGMAIVRETNATEKKDNCAHE